MKKRVIQRVVVLALILTLSLSLCISFPMEIQAVDNVILRQSDGASLISGLKNPIIVENSDMEAKQKVTWDCVYFGNYPQAEIVASAEQYTAVDKQFLKKGDIIEDSDLYNKLQNSIGWNENNDIEIDGNRYRRMQSSDGAPYTMSGLYYSWSDVMPGDYAYFKYEPIKWRVLKVDDSRAFLLSDVVLDSQEFNIKSELVPWSISTIRSWLNGYAASANKCKKDYSSRNFIDSAFSPEGKAAIVNMSEANNNDGGEIDEANSVTDRLFLLSPLEVYGNRAEIYGFSSEENINDEARRSTSSTYAKARGALGTDEASKYEGNCSWWLRSEDLSFINIGGHGSGYGFREDFDSQYDGIRVALNLELSSDDQWSYAGTVCSDGTVNENESGDNNDGSGDEKDPDYEVEKRCIGNIKKATPDMSNLGSGTLKGPEVSILGNKFNLFKTDMEVSLPFLNGNNASIKYNRKDKTAEVLIGVQEKEISTKDDDTRWSETYSEVKSLVKACGGKVDSNKLWNRFSKLRGKLKSLDEKAVFKAKGNVAGYMKFQMGDDGSIQRLIESGIAGGFEAGANVKRAKIWWIIYSDLGISGAIDGKWYTNILDPDSITYEGELKLAVKPTVALGADAVVVDVKGGINGEIAGSVKFPWTSFKKSVNAYLTGNVFIKVETPIPWIIPGNKTDDKTGKEWSYKFDQFELYPDLGKVIQNKAALLYSEPEPISRQMVRQIAPDAENAVDTTEEALVYENAKPEMIRLSDGRILMVYIDDTEEEPKLMYRIYNGSEWSDSKVVWTGGNLDTAGHLYQYNDSVYVIFDSSNQKITEDMSVEQITEAMDLYVSEFTTDGFEEPVKLGNSGTWKYAYQLTERNGRLWAVWAENSDNDIMLNSGNTVIYESELTDTWQTPSEIAEMDQVVTEVVSGTVGDEAVTAYVKDNQIYISDELLDISGFGENADSLRIQDGKMYARIDGMLYTYNGQQLEAKNVECSTSYQICDDTAFWIQQNNFQSEIISKTLDSETNPVAITDDGGYIGGFTVMQNSERKPVISYTYQQVDENAEGNPYGATILKFAEDIRRYQAEVSNVAYDILSFVPGKENPVEVTICNTGTEIIHQVSLIISDGDKVIYNEKIAESLKPGEINEYEIPVQIPEDFSKRDLTFALTADEAFNNNLLEQYELEYCNTDVEVTEKNVDEIAVKNNSQSDADDVMVILRDQNENGTEIRKISVGNLKSEETKTLSVKEDWKKATKDSGSNKKYIYCEVTQGSDEYELWNNSIVMEKQVNETSDESTGNNKPNTSDGTSKPDATAGASNRPVKPSVSQKAVKISKITLSGISKKIAAGKKITLKAAISPYNASNKAVTWKSSNTKYATVSSKGVVTMKKAGAGKTVKITATAKDGSKKTASYKIKCMKGVVKKIKLTASKTVKAGKKVTVKKKVTASKGANTTLSYSVSNKKYATVNSKGVVTAKKAGKGKTVTVTAKATDGSGKKATVKIKIK